MLFVRPRQNGWKQKLRDCAIASHFPPRPYTEREIHLRRINTLEMKKYNRLVSLLLPHADIYSSPLSEHKSVIWVINKNIGMRKTHAARLIRSNGVMRLFGAGSEKPERNGYWKIIHFYTTIVASFHFGTTLRHVNFGFHTWHKHLDTTTTDY